MRSSALRPSSATSTVPLRSVRAIRAPMLESRARVAEVGWPYGLPSPAEITAIAGCTVARNGSVDDVRLP